MTTTIITRDFDGNQPGFGLHVPTDNPCPVWCVDTHGHGYDDETDHAEPTRYHLAFEDHFAVEEVNKYGNHDELSVSVHTREAVDPDTAAVVDSGRPMMWLCANTLNELQPAEARRLAADLLAAADELEGLQTAPEGVELGPDPEDVAAVRGLLEMMNRTGFASDDQRARYLLSSNWLRDRGAAAAQRLSNPPGVLAE